MSDRAPGPAMPVDATCLACDLIQDPTRLPGGRVGEIGPWVVEHCIGPLGVGTFVVKPTRHVVHLADLDPVEIAELGPALARVAGAVSQAASEDGNPSSQVYTCLWSHADRAPGHIHFVVQPVSHDLMERFDAHGPALQLRMFEANEPMDPMAMERVAHRVRALLTGPPKRMTVREVTVDVIGPHDDGFEAVVELFDRYRVHYAQPSDRGRSRAWLTEATTTGPMRAFLARVGSTPAGVCFVAIVPASLALARLWLVRDLYVEPAWRRRGVAQALLDAVRAVAERDGATRLALQTEDDNEVALALYEGYGFRPTTGLRSLSLELVARDAE